MSVPAFLDAGPDTGVIARQVVKSKKSKGKAVPAVIDLATAITDIQIDDTINGSSTLTLTVADPDWALLDSGFFDANKDGRLDTIDVRYPEDSRFWWRLTQVQVSANTVGMVFMERAAAHLIAHRGPLKVSRSKKTRAEFLAMLAAKVRAGGGIRFVCKELKTKQPQDPTDKPKAKDAASRKADKDAGINSGEQITFTNWDGGEYTLKAGELQNAERALDAAGNAPERAVLALLCACIVEAPFFRNPSSGHSSSVGILQLLDMHLGGSVTARRDIAKVTDLFMTKGFTGAGGAEQVAQDNPGMSPGKIAQTVQGSAHPDRYDKVLDGAKKVLAAYGGAGATGATGGGSRKQYNFEVGSPEEPRETYWDAMNRLAEEVKWPLFLDGQNLYFDSEMTLIKQKPAAVIDRDDPAVISWDVTWDARNIATDLTLDLICDPFEFRAGEVLKLTGFGPASTGSTAKLPGRWLISEISRSRFELASSFSLKQPEKPDPEPAADSIDRKDSDSSDDGGTATGSLREKIVKIAEGSMTTRTGFKRYSQAGALTTDLTPQNARTDCSQWIRAVYLKAGAGDPGSNTFQMSNTGKVTSKPKPGDIMLTANTGHCELYVGNGKTIGHGSPPIDAGTVSSFPGHRFVTYAFLDAD